jgi:hypothetical protein
MEAMVHLSVVTLSGTNLLEQAKRERDRLNKVIALLEGATTTVKPAKTAKKHGHKWTAAERKAMSLRQRAAWRRGGRRLNEPFFHYADLLARK